MAIPGERDLNNDSDAVEHVVPEHADLVVRAPLACLGDYPVGGSLVNLLRERAGGVAVRLEGLL